MCGLGVNCQIDSGKPSKERMLLLRREGLELALYSFRYLKDVKQVVVLIPATPGKAQTVALYFSRDALRPELDRPLTSSLLPKAPTTKTVTLSPDARLVDQTTNPYLFSLMGSSFNDRGYLDIAIVAPTGGSLDLASLTDLQPEFTIAINGSATNAIRLDDTQAPILLRQTGSTYVFRYWTRGTYTAGDVTVAGLTSCLSAR